MPKQTINKDNQAPLSQSTMKPKRANKIVIHCPNTPVMTESMFAQVSGLTAGEVRGQADRENLPTVRYGRKRLINIRQIERDCEAL